MVSKISLSLLLLTNIYLFILKSKIFKYVLKYLSKLFPTLKYNLCL